jgi:beta-mannosidase
VNEKAQINVRLVDFEGQVKYEFIDSIFVTSKQNQSVITVPLNELLKNKKDSISLVLEAIYNSATTCKQALHYFCESKNLALQNDEIDISILDDTTLEIKSKTLQKNVWIYHSEKSLNFSDNFFDLLPNQSREIKLEAGGLKAMTLKKMSLNQIH